MFIFSYNISSTDDSLYTLHHQIFANQVAFVVLVEGNHMDDGQGGNPATYVNRAFDGRQSTRHIA